jgi:hypothetical protein
LPSLSYLTGLATFREREGQGKERERVGRRTMERREEGERERKGGKGDVGSEG